MKLERSKNAVRNVFFGTALKVFDVAVPFALRTVMIYYLGVQYVGLNSLCTSILSFLNLAELGVGNAMVFSMYKPIAEDNTSEIRALMGLYKFYHRVIGAVILVAGLAISPFLDKLISGDVPDGINIYIIYYLNLASTVLSYWLFSYKNSLLTAFQREDVKSKMGLATHFFQYILQFISLIVLRNYYLYLTIALATIAVKNIVTAAWVSKNYPQYYCEGKVPKEQRKKITNRVKDLFTAKVGGVIIGSGDTIVISAFLGLTQLAIYNNYYYIITSINGFLAILFNAVRAGFGNSFITESNDKVYSDFEVFHLMISWVIGFCTCCLFCLYQPFMKLWVGETLMFDNKMVILLCICFYVWKSTDIMETYKDAAGAWHTDRFRPFIASLVNLVSNIIMVHYIGIYGIVLSTIISYLFVSTPWLTQNVFSTVFKRSKKTFILKTLFYALVTIVATCMTYFICSLIPYDNVISLIVKMLICIIVPNVIFILVYKRTSEYSAVMEKAKAFVMKLTGRKGEKSDRIRR